ncbi:hypothetical protein [Microbacterium sp. MYb64]|uniref:hypothetical protein n=1 Tax=Microbacterium sp. MYb64 TaxID=1848691 RepID=UPI0011B06DA0|nr:hypothetical protein [Microbacterium sp. MYb64]
MNKKLLVGGLSTAGAAVIIAGLVVFGVNAQAGAGDAPAPTPIVETETPTPSPTVTPTPTVAPAPVPEPAPADPAPAPDDTTQADPQQADPAPADPPAPEPEPAPPVVTYHGPVQWGGAPQPSGTPLPLTLDDDPNSATYGQMVFQYDPGSYCAAQSGTTRDGQGQCT